MSTLADPPTYNGETTLIIINKNKSPYKLSLKRFLELNLSGKRLKNVISGEYIKWTDSITLNEGSLILTTTD